MARKICVVGQPSKLGGADTELEHQILLWLKNGIEVYVCSTLVDLDDNAVRMKKEMEAVGCRYLPRRSWKDLSGFDVVSFCNRPFLENLPEIKKYARSTTFANCMTWNFDKEIEMQGKGLIDFHLYQTDHQMKKVGSKLEGQGTYRPMMIRPYFHREAFPFVERKTQEFFRFGRISRCDGDKYGGRQVWIWETMTAPVLKRGLVLGWDGRSEKKVGRLPSYVKGHEAGGITQQEFYRQCDVIVMTTDTFENLPRVGFEAMSSGTLLVVDDRGGWRVLVEDGKTGWLCRDDREFVYKASRSAFEFEESNEMRLAARAKLEREWGEEESMKSWERVFRAWDSLK